MRNQSIGGMMRSSSKKSGSAIIWLAYSFFFFIEPVVSPSRFMWFFTILIFAIFVPVFFTYIYTESEDTRRGMILSTFMLGIIAFPFNGGASTFFIYTAAYIPFSFPSIRLALSLMGVEVAAIGIETYAHHLLHPHDVFWPNALIAVLLLLIVGGSNIFFAEQRRAECKLREAQDENVALAAVAERERIARDLHDVLGHTLSLIVLKAELAGRLIERDPARAASEIGEVERTARTALAEVREAIGGYRARGLTAEIEAARKTLDAAGVLLTCDTMPATNTGLRANEETVLALALREAVTNIVRHAKATQCTLRFALEDGQHRLVVEDNGEHLQQREGNGLRGMRERVEALGGHLTLDRNPGTRLQIALPVREGSIA